MTASPPPTLYHRWMGWHAPALRRVAILACIGLAVTLVLLPILPWQVILASLIVVETIRYAQIRRSLRGT